MAINSIYFEYFGISLENIYKWKVCAVAIRGISFWNFLDFSFDFFYFLQTNWGSFENAFGFVFFFQKYFDKWKVCAVAIRGISFSRRDNKQALQGQIRKAEKDNNNLKEEKSTCRGGSHWII